MKVVAMVPIKLNNQRTPGKNIRPFSDGTPLITVFLRTLLNVKEIDSIYVFCSNSEITEYLIDGVEFLERPKYLDTQEATPQDILSEFTDKISADIYIAAHCTSPFVTAEHISECIQKVECGEYDSAFTGERIQKLLWQNGEPMNFQADNVPRTQDLQLIYAEVSAAYVFKKEVFERLHRRIGLHPYICEVSGIECVDIDYPEDFELADAIYTNLIKQ